MFPEGFVESDRVTETQAVGEDFLFDYGTGQHLMKGGSPEKQSVFIGVKQYIENVLRTPAGTVKVYTKDETESFGISVYKYLGQRNLPTGYLGSELKREITENLLRHPLISDVTDWKSEREPRGLKIEFSAVLEDGSIINFSELVGEEGVIDV